MSENGEHTEADYAIVCSIQQRDVLHPCRNEGENMIHFYKTVKTPVGLLKLVAGNQGLVAILWENDDPKRVRLGTLQEDNDHPTLREAERQLAEYFSGKTREFSLKTDFIGTKFQKQVWAALAAIPFGETRSYAEIAKQI